MFCEKCGTKLDDDAMFCTKCGHKVDAVTDEAVETQPHMVPIPHQRDSVPEGELSDKEWKKTKILAGTALALLLVTFILLLTGVKEKSIENVKDNKQNEVSERSERKEDTEKEEAKKEETSDKGITAEENKDNASTKDTATDHVEWVTSVKEITDEALNMMKIFSEASFESTSMANAEDYLDFTEIQYVGSCFLNSITGRTEHDNSCITVYSCIASSKNDPGKSVVTPFYFAYQYFDLKKSSDGSVDVDVSAPERIGDLLAIDTGDSKFGMNGFDSLEDLQSYIYDNFSQEYNIEFDIQNIPEEFTSLKGTSNVTDLFEIDPNTPEDYSANLNPDDFGYYNSNIADFSFWYPKNIYNDVWLDESDFHNEYGKHLMTYTFFGDKGSRLEYSLTRRTDDQSISEMTDYVHSTELYLLEDSSEIKKSTTSDHGKVIVTGWEDSSKEYIVYDMTKIENTYILQMKVYMTDFTDENDKNEKSYVTECDYRYCGFGDSKYPVRTYEEYLENN